MERMPGIPENTGYRESEYIEGDHYVLGGYTGLETRPIVNLTGKWGAYATQQEAQNAAPAGETNNCTGFGTTHALECLMRMKFGVPEEDSERYLGIVAGTSLNGNDPHKVAEALRNNGIVKEASLPFSYPYYEPNPPTPSLLAEAKAWLAKWKFSHEWAIAPNSGLSLAQKQSLLKTGLKLSPLGVSVHAWAFPDDDGLIHRSPGDKDNHWVTLVDYVDQKYWVVLDSYPNVLGDTGSFLKKLAWDYDFGCAKVYYVDQSQVVPQNQFQLIMSQILGLMAQILKLDMQILQNNAKKKTP